jgi:AI-2 transport protein TqsA
VLGLLPPALLQGGVWQAVLVIVAYSVINVMIQSLLQPKFVGDAVGLSVTPTFLPRVFWTFVIGPLGALLAVPPACSSRRSSWTPTRTAAGSTR